MLEPEPLPAYVDYFVPTVHCLRARGGSATIEEMEEDVAAAMGLSEAQRSILHGDGPQTEFGYRLAWVRTYLKKVGAVENSTRGVWRLTQKGAEMFDEEIRDVRRQVRTERRLARKAQAASRAVKPEDTEEPEDVELSWKEREL